jgi:hypothetical protein
MTWLDILNDGFTRKAIGHIATVLEANTRRVAIPALVSHFLNKKKAGILNKV